jgi:hypothetical protein
MKNTRTYILLTTFCFLLSISVFAQKQQHEFSISAGGGFSALCFHPLVKKTTSTGYCGDIVVGFTGFISQQWGIHIGVGFGLNNFSTKVKQLDTFTPELIDKNDYIFDLYTTLSSYQENHQTIFLHVPLMLQFQTKIKQGNYRKKSQKTGFYAMGGVKAFFIVNNQYEARVESLFNAAYYPEYDNWATTQIFAGLSKFDGSDASGNLKLNLLLSFAFETGVKSRIGKRWFLYSGIFFDCGLNDPTKKSRQPLSNYIYPEYLQDFTLLGFSKRVHLMSAGIKLRLSFFRIPRITSCPC